MGERLTGMHRYLYKWHCRKFFNFQQKFLASERAYAEAYFENVAHDDARSPGRYSYCTYSHRVRNDQVNSSRLGLGTVAHPQGLHQPALDVLSERGLEVEPEFTSAEYSHFYGLAWDFRADHFKIYFRVMLDRLQSEAIQKLLSQVTTRGEGLVSFTWVGSHLEEQKVYVYPDPNEELPDGTLRQAQMVTDRRGVVPQYDVEVPADWTTRISPVGQRIARLYEGLGLTLDTIAYQDPENYTLYFPNSED